MTPTNSLAVALDKITELERKLGIAKRGLHILSIRYGTEGLAARYLAAVEQDSKEAECHGISLK